MKKNIPKIYLVFIFIFIGILKMNGQANPCRDVNWNWLDESDANWTYRPVNSGNNVLMGSPLGDNKNRNTGDFYDMFVGEDNTKEEGWTLLAKDFGCTLPIEYPYFILYNRYKGIIRLFVYGGPIGLGANKAIVTLEWENNTYRTSLLSPQNIHCYANSLYLADTTLPIEKGLHVTDPYYQTYWFSADFLVAFDQNTDNSKTGFMLKFAISLVEQSEVELDGAFQFTTRSYALKGDAADKTPSSSGSLKDYAVKGKGFVEKIPDYDKMVKGTEKAKKDLEKFSEWTCDNFEDTKAGDRFAVALMDASNAFGKNGEIRNVLEGIGSAGGVIGTGLKTVIGIYDLFSGKAKSTPAEVKMQPTISNGTMSLSGNIITSTPTLPIKLELSGTKHSGSLTNTPYYDCPLGVVSLETEPDLLIRKWTENSVNYGSFTFKTFFNGGTLYSNYPSVSPSDSVCFFNQGNKTESWKSVRINSDLKIAVNASAGVELTDCKVAIVAKIRSIDKDQIVDSAAYGLKETKLPAAYNNSYVFADDYGCTKGCWDVFLTGYKGYTLDDDNPWKNKTLRYLNDNFYSLTNIDSAGFAEFSTPLIDVENFKNTSITVREETDLYLKVFCTLKAKDAAADTTPIIIWNIYKLTNDSETAADSSNNTPFPFTKAQLIDTRVDFEDDLLIPSNERLTYFKDKTITSGTYSNWGIVADSNVSINTSGDVTLNAYNNFSLKPGFSLKVNGTNKFKVGFVANSGIINTNYTPITSIATPYFSTCDITLKSAQDESMYDLENSEGFSFVNNVYPNPFKDELRLFMNLRENESANVQVTNMMGQVIYSNSNFSNEEIINTCSFNKGMYLIHILRGDKSFTIKTIKK